MTVPVFSSVTGVLQKTVKISAKDDGNVDTRIVYVYSFTGDSSVRNPDLGSIQDPVSAGFVQHGPGKRSFR